MISTYSTGTLKCKPIRMESSKNEYLMDDSAFVRRNQHCEATAAALNLLQ